MDKKRHPISTVWQLPSESCPHSSRHVSNLTIPELPALWAVPKEKAENATVTWDTNGGSSMRPGPRQARTELLQTVPKVCLRAMFDCGNADSTPSCWLRMRLYSAPAQQWHPPTLTFTTCTDNKYGDFAWQKIKVIIKRSDQYEWGESQYSHLLWLLCFFQLFKGIACYLPLNTKKKQYTNLH